MTYNLFFNRYSSSAYIFNFAMACNQVYDLYFSSGIPMYEITKYVFKAYEGAFSTIPSSDGMRWIESLLNVNTMRTSPIEAVDIYPFLKQHFLSISSEVDLNRLKSDKKLELLRESKKNTAKTLNLISELKKSSLIKSSSTSSEMAKVIYQQLDKIDLLNKMNSMKSIDFSDRELSRLSASYLIGSLLEAELILGIARSLESPISEYSVTYGKVYMDWVKRNIERAKSSFLNKTDEESHLNEVRGLEVSSAEVFINGMESMDLNEIEMDVFKELYVKDFIKHFEHDEYAKELFREISELVQGGLRVVSIPRKDIAIENCIDLEGELKLFQEKESSNLSIDSQEERAFKNKYLEDYEVKICAIEERKNLEGGLKSFVEGGDFYLRADGNEINISSSLGGMEVDGNEINAHAPMGGLETDANESSTYKGNKELSSGSTESIVLVGRVTETGLKLFNDNSEEIVSIRSDKGQIIARSNGDFSLERDLPGITIGQRIVVKLEVDGGETNIIKRRAQERALSSFEDDQEWVREVQSLTNRIVKKSGIKGVESELSQIQIGKWTETEKPSEPLNEIGSPVFASNSKVDSLVPLVKSFIEGRSSSVKKIEGARRVGSNLVGVSLFKHPTQASVDRQLLSPNRRSLSLEKSQGGTFSENLVSKWVDGKNEQGASSRSGKLLEGKMNNLSVLGGRKIVDSEDGVFLNVGEEISLSSNYLDINGQKNAESLEMGNTQIAIYEEVKFVEKTSGDFSEGPRYNGLASDKKESTRDVYLLSMEGFKQETLLEKIRKGASKKEGLLNDEQKSQFLSGDKQEISLAGQKSQFLSGDKQETLLEKIRKGASKKEGLLNDEQKSQFLSGDKQEISLAEQGSGLQRGHIESLNTSHSKELEGEGIESISKSFKRGVYVNNKEFIEMSPDSSLRQAGKDGEGEGLSISSLGGERSLESLDKEMTESIIESPLGQNGSENNSIFFGANVSKKHEELEDQDRISFVGSKPIRVTSGTAEGLEKANRSLGDTGVTKFVAMKSNQVSRVSSVGTEKKQRDLHGVIDLENVSKKKLGMSLLSEGIMMGFESSKQLAGKFKHSGSVEKKNRELISGESKYVNSKESRIGVIGDGTIGLTQLPTESMSYQFKGLEKTARSIADIIESKPISSGKSKNSLSIHSSNLGFEISQDMYYVNRIASTELKNRELGSGDSVNVSQKGIQVSKPEFSGLTMKSTSMGLYQFKGLEKTSKDLHDSIAIKPIGPGAFTPTLVHSPQVGIEALQEIGYDNKKRSLNLKEVSLYRPIVREVESSSIEFNKVELISVDRTGSSVSANKLNKSLFSSAREVDSSRLNEFELNFSDIKLNEDLRVEFSHTEINLFLPTLLEKGKNTEVTIIGKTESGGSGVHLEPGEGDQIKEIVIKKPNNSSSEAIIAVSIVKNKKTVERGGLDLHIVSITKAKLEPKSVEIGIIKKITSVEKSGVEASLVITTSGIELYKTEASVLRDISRNLEQRMIEVKVENNIMALEAQSSEIRKLKEWAAYSLIHEAMVSKPNSGREELPEEFEDAGPSGMESREIEVDSSHNPSSLERAHEEIHRHEASTLERGSIEATVHSPIGFDETPEEFEGQDTSSLEGSPVEVDKYSPSSHEYVPSEFEGQETSDLESGPVELSIKKLPRGSEESEEEFKDQLPSDLEKDLSEMQIKKTGSSFEEGEEEFDEQNSNDLEKDKYEMRIDTSHIKEQEEHEQEFDSVEGTDVEQYSVELFIAKISKIIEEGSEEFSEEYPLGMEMGSREMSFYQNELIPVEQKKTDTSKGIHLRGLQSNTVDVLKGSHIKTATVSAMEVDKRTKPIVGFKNRWNFFIGDAQDHIFLSPRLTKVGELVALRERCIKDLTIGPSAPTNIYKFPISGAELRAKLRIWVHEIETPEDYVREMESIGGHLINAIKDEFEYDETSFKQTLEQVVFKYRDLFIEFFQDQLLVESTIEAKISLSAMVNFFLFYEQIIHVNMGWYSHTTVREGVSNMKRFLKGWIDDEGVDLSPGSLPEKNEIPQDYIHLVRWCEWFLDAELSFSGQNYEMSAYESLVNVRDQMVHYFTTHWGIREVEYGPDGKFIYSEEFSRITKVRGRKHKNPLGYNGRPQSQSMEDIYNIDLHDLLYYLKEE